MTVEQIRANNVAKLEKELMVVEYVRDNVLPLLRKHDGKKITKRISNDLKKNLEGVAYLKIYDIYANNISIDYKKERYKLELKDTRSQVGWHWVSDDKLNYEVTETNVLGYIEKLSKSIENFNKDTDTLAVAKKLDSIYEEYQNLIDSLSYEEKVLVSHDIKNNPKNLTDISYYSRY